MRWHSSIGFHDVFFHFQRDCTSHARQSSQKKQSSTPVHTADEAHEEEEVHTLRKEKKALKDELEQTKAKQMNFEAAFQTEFDLRTTMEEKYDSLRERYEVNLLDSIT